MYQPIIYLKRLIQKNTFSIILLALCLILLSCRPTATPMPSTATPMPTTTPIPPTATPMPASMMPTGTLMLEPTPALNTIIETVTSTTISDSPSQQIPLADRDTFLPHNGLFVRRNNQFGTNLSEGVKKLISQGELIDQTLIRFDDFVASKSDQVPLPESGQSVAVNYGLSKIPLNAKRDERATHYLEIALKTSDSALANQTQDEIFPVNYIFVIDISDSMNGEKLDIVKTTIRKLFAKLKENDVIGIVAFDDQPRTLLEAKPVGQIAGNEFSELISNITTRGGTDLNLGVLYGIAEMNRYRNEQRVNQLFLFSDGNPTSGETDWIRIRQNVQAQTRGNIRLTTFAFGSDANIRELDALAGLTGGVSTFVKHPDDVQLILQEELTRREHLAAINVQMKIEIDSDIPIVYLYGHDQVTDPVVRAAVLQDVESAKERTRNEFDTEPLPNIVTEEEGIRIFVPDMAIGETYWVVFELALPDERKSSFGQAVVQYVDAFAKQNKVHEFPLTLEGKLPPELITEHALGLWTSEVVFYALDDLYQADLTTAEARIQRHISALISANAELSSQQLTDDIVTLEKFQLLSQNLGKVKQFGDTPSNQRTDYLVYALNAFGRVRNGFSYVNYQDSK